MRVAACAVGAVLLILALPSRVAGLEPGALVRAERIRVTVDHRYRTAAGRKLAVVDASRTGVVESLTLLDDVVRAVPAANGIYFTLCSPGATCPFPRAAAAWKVGALRPRRAAFELAVRVFASTSADLVVVALPTRTPVLVVLERERLRESLDPGYARAAYGDPADAEARISCIVDENTLPFLYVPMGLESVSDTQDTFIAGRLYLDAGLPAACGPSAGEGASNVLGVRVPDLARGRR